MNLELKAEKMKFGNRLKELRVDAKLSESELAKKLNVQKFTIKKWESGITTPRFYKLIELCNLFNVSFDYIAGLSNIKKRTKSKFLKKKSKNSPKF